LKSASFGKKHQALYMFALRPLGGSLLSLIDLSRMPMGISLLDLAERSNLKFGLPPPIFCEILSNYFSRLLRNFGIRWIFCSINHNPSLND
jgi:hypothetical protein